MLCTREVAVIMFAYFYICYAYSVVDLRTWSLLCFSCYLCSPSLAPASENSLLIMKHTLKVVFIHRKKNIFLLKNVFVAKLFLGSIFVWTKIDSFVVILSYVCET